MPRTQYVDTVKENVLLKPAIVDIKGAIYPRMEYLCIYQIPIRGLALMPANSNLKLVRAIDY